MASFLFALDDPNYAGYQVCMKSAQIIQLTAHRGNPRLWLQGRTPMRAGFMPGCKYTVSQNGDGVRITISENGERTVSKKVYRSGLTVPVLDINKHSDLAPLDGHTSVKVVFGQNCVEITPLASERRRVSRLARLKSRVSKGESLACAGIAAGLGVLSRAVHEGLDRAGIMSHLAVYNEIRSDITEHALSANPVINDQTIVLTQPMQELAFDRDVLDRVGEVDIVEIGLPCSGASLAGRAKRGLSHAEDHPDVGHLAAPALALIAQLNPVAAIFENVPQYANTASASIIRKQLMDLGYECSEAAYMATDFGDVEARRRWVLVAVTRGIPFTLDDLPIPGQGSARLADILDPIDSCDVTWSEMRGLKEKRARDLSRGNNFRMQIFDADSPSINTLTKGLSKNRSTDPKIRHPHNPSLLRVPTVAEHARAKGEDPSIVAGASKVLAHEMLGQSVSKRMFSAIAAHVGRALKAWVEQLTPVVAMPTNFKHAA